MKRSVLLSLTGITLQTFVFLITVQASSQLRDIPHGGGANGVESARSASVDPPRHEPGVNILVNPDGSGDVATIREALLISTLGDTILLGPGVFTGVDNHGIHTQTPCTIRSIAGPESTIIDCEGGPYGFAFGEFYPGDRACSEQRPPDSDRRAPADAVWDEPYTVEGVTIRNVGGGEWSSVAIYVDWELCVIRNCVISEIRGNGLYIDWFPLEMSHSIVEKCDKTGVVGSATLTDCTIRLNGAGVVALGATLTRCSITDNEGCAIEAEGGANITDCDISRNGGGALIAYDGPTSITNSRIQENGGTKTGVVSASDFLVFENNLVVHNSGSVLRFDSMFGWGHEEFCANIVGNTFVNNDGVGKPLLQIYETAAAIDRNIFAFNAVPNLLGLENATAAFTRNDVFPYITADSLLVDPAQGNFSADPWFCNGFADDYTLQNGSPCLPENNPDGVLIGALGQGCTALEPVLNITPSVLGGQLRGAMKAMVALDDGVDVTDIDPATIRLGGVLAPETVDPPGGGAKSKFTVEFQRPDVLGLLLPVTRGEVRRVCLTAQTHDGRALRATGAVTISHVDGLPESSDDDATWLSSTPAIIPGIASVTPNPFNPTTRIRFGVVHEGPVDLTVYDVAGRVVERLVHDTMPAGNHEVTWSAGGVASGVYFARLTSPEGNHTTKLVVMK